MADKEEKKTEKAGKLCQLMRSSIDDGLSFKEAAVRDSLEIVETGLISIRSNVPKIGRDSKFTGTAFRLDLDEISQPVKGDRGYYLMKVTDKSDANMSLFENEKENRKSTLLQQKKQMVYMAWYEKLKEKANIKDYRDQYFN